MQILSRPGEVGATPTQAENFEAAVGAEGDANSDEEIKIENIPF